MKNLIRILIKWYIKVKFGWVFNVSSMYQFLMRIFRTPRIGDIYIYITLEISGLQKWIQKWDLCRQEPIQFHYLFSNSEKFARMT